MRRLTADWIVPVSRPPLRNGTITLDDEGRVVSLEALPAPDAESMGGVLTPGLVNAHVHIELSALREKVPGEQGFIPWVLAMLAERRALERDRLRAEIPAAVAELGRYGTVAVGEVTNTLDAVEPLAEAGLWGVVFHEVLEIDEVRKGDGIADLLAQKAALPRWPERLRYAIAPHAPYSTGPDLIRRAIEAVPDVVTTIHVAEDGDELALLERGEGPHVDLLKMLGLWERTTWVPKQRPVAYLDSLGLLERRPAPLLVHMVHAERADLARVAQRNVPIVLCPRSNLYIGGRLPDVTMMLRTKVRLALGTDSLASNRTLSLWAEMATLARAFPHLDRATLFEWATLGGAEALKLDDRLGSLEPGNRPGLLHIRGDAGWDPYRFLCESEPEEVTWLARA